MLTETSSSQQRIESMSSTNFNKQQQFQQTQNMAADQRQHEALASLFRSLSSLASANSHQYPPQESVSLNLATNNASPIKRTSSSIANSIQSAVAAAVLQQQHQLNPPNPPQRPQLNVSHHHHPIVAPSAAYLCDQIKPAPNYHFLDQHQQMVPGLENDVQFSIPPLPPQTTTSTTMTTTGQPSSQRINYCTICNKELCNKYFMKTHMLKMHGINLEMEQQTMGRVENGDLEEIGPNDEGGDQDGAKNQQTGSDLTASSTQPVDQRNQNSSTSLSPDKQKQVSKTSGKSTQASASVKAGKTSMKQATSVLNGFAGNSMGGVVCDICNKELCSKYFLKVHKQNTHGIMTDYQDAGQFVYPFAVNSLANSFMASAMPMPPVANVLQFPTMCFNQVASSSSSGQAPINSDGCGLGCESGPSGHKRARAAGTEKTKRDHKQMRPLNNFNEFTQETGNEKALEPFYRLMLARQQQQQASGFDSINQMSAMMCYGAMGPFGPTAGISPAMVVEMILRNQHLFKRTNQQQQAIQSGRTSSKDKNNNNGDPQRKGSSSGAAGAKANSKESNNSRYFIHYTEACPMCDRRFKSIKWLKTHMMNDHKQEIGAHMQMMMQSMCPAKGQPAPAIIQDHHNQPFNQPNAGYSLGVGAQLGAGGQTTMLAQQQQHQLHHQLDPTTRPPPVSLCADQQQPPQSQQLSAQTTGLLQTIRSDHFSLIQNYLDQQRLVLQDQTGHNQTAVNLSSPESGQHQLATLNNLNVMKHSSSSSSSPSSASSSRSSSAKTSPRSMGAILNDDQQVDQLDLSLKCHNSENQSCAFDNGPAEFLQAASGQAKMEINQFFDDDDDGDRSTCSASRHEQAASEANA